MADVWDDGHQDQEILQNDEDTQREEEECGGADAGVAVWRGSILKAAGVIVMPQNHVVETGGGRQVCRKGIHLRAWGGWHEGGEDIYEGFWDSHRVSTLGEHAKSSNCGISVEILYSHRLATHSNHLSSLHVHNTHLRTHKKEAQD